MFLAGTPTLLAMEDFPGITIIPVGAEAGTPGSSTSHASSEATSSCVTPSLALHMIEKAPETMGDSVKALDSRP